MDEIRVLDCGFVRLEGFMGGDLSVVNSARVSFGKRSESMTEKEVGLINFLLKNHHGTPFESSVFTFHVKAPIFVTREWMRHRIASYNEYSLRYSEFEGDFYVPLLENVRTQVGKPGHYKFESVEKNIALDFQKELTHITQLAINNYKDAIENGVAKELARLFLPVNIYTQFYFTVNARSLMNFLSLRNHEHAMLEIRKYAGVLEDIFQDLMPITHNAFINNGRVAP